MKEAVIKRREASDERQYMMNENYEVYEKQGAPLGAATFHYHNFYEIIYVLEGEYSSMLENQTYRLRKGDFLLIDANVMHKYHFEEMKHDSSKRIILWITPEMLSTLSDGEMDLTECFRNGGNCAYHFPIYYEEQLRGYLLKLAMTQMMEANDEHMKRVADRGHLTLFFVYLNMLCKQTEYSYAREELFSSPLVEEVSNYIEEHLAEEILLDNLADRVHMSKYHFLRKFKELTGVTVHSFITNKRMIKACEALKAGENITRVAQMVGYTEYTSFLRNFKKTFGVAPGQYKDFY